MYIVPHVFGFFRQVRDITSRHKKKQNWSQLITEDRIFAHVEVGVGIGLGFRFCKNGLNNIMDLILFAPKAP
jgi:hypothetical protein